jgi:hypothetical protein
VSALAIGVMRLTNQPAHNQAADRRDDPEIANAISQ